MFCRPIAEDLASQPRERPSGGLSIFYYPNFKPDKPDNLRPIAIVGASDLALLRADAGAIIKVTDALLSDSVCSYRLNRSPFPPGTAWGFDRRDSWKNGFVAGGIQILDEAKFPFMCRTDIRKFYPSIQFDLLRESLLKSDCDRQAVERIFSFLKFWQEFYGLAGLPIGPEACAVLSNFFLRPVDELMVVAGAEYRRYGDDMLIFSHDRPMGEAVTEFLDEELNRLQLSRSVDKTEYFDDPAAAKSNLRDAEINYMSDAAHLDAGVGLYTARRGFRRLLYTAPEDLKPSQLRWVLKFLTNKREPDGCFELSSRADLMNVDPKVAVNYLAVGTRKQGVLANCMQRLAQPREERFDGLTLHQLRLMTQTKTGRDEAKEFERIATDQSTPWPTRSWGWAAYAHANSTKPSRLMEAARDEADPNIRRTIIATLKRHSDSSQCRTFLRDEAERCPLNKYTAEWAKTA